MAARIVVRMLMLNRWKSMPCAGVTIPAKCMTTGVWYPLNVRQQSIVEVNERV